MKGMRVQSIIRELRGEKIDIIEFSEEITTFAEKALQPAKVSRVSITDLAEKQLEVIVDDTQLSLAIGKKGQNVRLAAKLLQWKIDIKCEEEKRQEVEQQMQAMGGGPSTPIEQVTELGEAVMEKLIAAGITTVEALADMTAEELGEIPGIGEKTVEKIAVAVRHYFGQYEEGEERPAPGRRTEVCIRECRSSQPGEREWKRHPKRSSQTKPGSTGKAEEVSNLSTEDIEEAEEARVRQRRLNDNDAREERIELDNDTVDELVDQSQEISDEGARYGRKRSWLAGPTTNTRNTGDAMAAIPDKRFRDKYLQ